MNQYPWVIYHGVMAGNTCLMDKYERRRLNLIRIRDELCGGVAATLAEKIGRPANYVTRMLYPPDKAGRKRIAEDMVEIIEAAFNLPRGWMDDLTEMSAAAKPPLIKIEADRYAASDDEAELLRNYRRLPETGGARLRVKAALADELAALEQASTMSEKQAPAG